MVKGVYWTKPAEEDLEEIYTYYKKKVSKEFATKLKNKLLDAPDILLLPKVKTIKVGQVDNLLKYLNQEHRYLIEGHYKIIYFIQDNGAYITHTFDTRQDPVKKLR